MNTLLLFFCINNATAEQIDFHQNRSYHNKNKEDVKVMAHANGGDYLELENIKLHSKITERVYYKNTQNVEYKVFYQTNGVNTRAASNHALIEAEIQNVFSDYKYVSCETPYFSFYFMDKENYKQLIYPNDIFEFGGYWFFLCENCGESIKKDQIKTYINLVTDKACITAQKQ